jgi:hypothetical protein
LQSDGDPHFVEAIQTFHGEYVIDNEETGERVFVSTRDETKN